MSEQEKTLTMTLKIKCGMTVPRYAPTVFNRCVYETLIPLGIPILQSGGAFWNQGIEHVLESIAEDKAGYDAALIMDFDTMFHWNDLLTLIDIFQSHPEIDALAPVQARRGTGEPLFARYTDGIRTTPTAEEIAQETMPVTSAAFGLTLIRMESLRKLAHPWFWGQPNKDGRWGEDKLDDDMWFWDRWREAGNNLHIANRVVVGHLAEVVLWPALKGGAICQDVQVYHNTGKPDGAWI